MKKYIISIFLVTLCVSMGNAQRWELNKANRLFEKRAYLEAAEIYERSDKDVNTLRNLGDCYYFNTKMDEAVKWYGTLVKNYGDQIDYQYLFRYSQALKGVKRYDEADEWMKKYEEAQANDESLQKTLEYMAKVDADVPYIYEPKNAGTNTEYSDFGTAFFGERVVFSSSKKTAGNAKLYKWNDQPYLDLYSAAVDSEGNLIDPEPLGEAINTNTHDALAVFTKDGKTMYFSRTNEKKVKVNEEKVANVKIYKAEFVDGKWTNVEPLPFNSDEYSCGHPALNFEENKLYFASDMPGSIGSLDIFEVDLNEDGTYGTPKNLGTKVNTTKRDEFPYMSEYNILYFASNGHLGLGNLDLFSSALEEGTFGKPNNLGSSVNSSLDDFALIINERTDVGYFSSNRGEQDDDIFQFKRKEYIKPVYLVEGIVTDKNSGEVLPNSLVTLLDENNNVIADTIVKADGKYIFHLDPNQKYKVRGTRKLYIPDEQDFSTDSEGRIQHDIQLELELYSDAEGNIVTENGDTVIKLEKIYFDFDKWDIKPQAAQVLDGLVEVMKKYPNMIIEISAHTDCRGGLDYNLELSHKRAKSTLDYVVSQGIDASRLKSIGYGEMQPVNKCVREGMCSDEEYDVNRRCEFKLLN